MINKNVFDCIDLVKQNFSRFDVENLLRKQLTNFLSDMKWKYVLMKISPPISEQKISQNNDLNKQLEAIKIENSETFENDNLIKDGYKTRFMKITNCQTQQEK